MKTQKKVLIIEDNEDLCDIFSFSYRAEGFLVEIAKKGMDGIMKAIDFRPDVILLDIMMPEVDGFEVLHAMRQNTSLDVLIIVHSSLEQEKDIRLAFDMGADEYLKKSAQTPMEVVQRTQDLLQGDASQQEDIGDTSCSENVSETGGVFFPKDILNRFSIVQMTQEEEKIIFLLEEKNIVPPEISKYTQNPPCMNGFLPLREVPAGVFQEKEILLKVSARLWTLPQKNISYVFFPAYQSNMLVLVQEKIS